MKATLENPKASGLKSSHRKENGFYESYEVIVFENGRFGNPISLRMYATNSTNYACIWINAMPIGKRKYSVHISGSGKAGGYGYHRASAAAHFAIQSAGFILDESISGRGDSAIIEALTSICKELGFKKFYIQKSHA